MRQRMVVRTDGASDLSAIISKRRNNLLVYQGYKALIIRILFLVIAGMILFTRIFLVTQASGNDMFPAVKDGDLVLAFRLQQGYSKNDVVVYTVDGTQYIGRIAAGAGDVVTLDDSGSMLVNGTAQTGEILYPTYGLQGLEYPYEVPENSLFILGDYRTQAADSRTFGAISLENVDGKVITILRRRGL